MPPRRRKKVNDNLLARIAAVLEQDVEEIRAVAKPELATYEEKVLQRQSIINYYRTVISAKEPTQKSGESKAEFAKRLTEWQNARNEWRRRRCEGCNLEFVYAYHYEGVKFCTLECMDAELRKIGVSVTPQKGGPARWGPLYHPAIVPASAVKAFEDLFPDDSTCETVPSE